MMDNIDFDIKPCVNCGYCCTTSPCMHGEWNDDKSGCVHLTEPNDIDQKFCAKYEKIKKKDPDWHIYPAFGAGCSGTIANTARQNIIKKLNEQVTN